VSQPPPAAAGRGLLLIAGAVLIGFVLLSQGFGDDPVSSNRASGTEADVSADSTPSSTIADENGQPTLDPSQVTVVVANATSTQGLAGQYSETLAGAGYITSEPATASAPSDTTGVYFLNDFQSYENEAKGVASALGLPNSVVQPLPAEIALETTGAELVIVIIGADIDALTGGGDGGGSSGSTTIPGT
jgi:hypothetical protein